MVPHIIFSKRPRYWWDRRVWRSWISPLAINEMASSGISQPPMLADAVVRVGQQLSDEQRVVWYQSVYSQLVAYHLWLYRERDPYNQGLVVQLHPWETGLDNSPPCMIELHDKNWPWWLTFLENTKLEHIGDYFRADYKYVGKGERSSNLEALALYNLLRKIRRDKYDSSVILQDPSFAIHDITYNSILIRANSLLLQIAKTIGQELPPELTASTSKASVALENLWDEESSQYYSGQFLTGKLIKEPSIGTLLPLYSGAISQKRANELVKLMERHDLFELKFPVPTVPINSPRFKSKRYWQGPTWINTNWLIIDGLKRYGFYEQADALTLSSLELVNKSGFYEYFNPRTGAASGVDNFSWTAALIIDLAHDFQGFRK
jgi:hypothetical protein